jgi:DNA-binding NtrC family response regulator
MEQAEPLSTRESSQDGSTSAAAVEASSTVLTADYDVPFKEAKEKLVAAFEKEYLSRLLERTEGNIAKAAREAAIDRKHLYTLLAKHGLGSDNGS